MASEAKKNRTSGFVASCLPFVLLIIILAADGHAAGVTLTTSDQGNGGVALTATGHFATCTYCCDGNGNSYTVDTGSVSAIGYCSDSGHGSGTCTYILDRGGLHGTRTFYASASDCQGSASDSTTTNFDNTPKISITSPRGTVRGSFDVAATVNFKPTDLPPVFRLPMAKDRKGVNLRAMGGGEG